MQPYQKWELLVQAASAQARFFMLNTRGRLQAGRLPDAHAARDSSGWRELIGPLSDLLRKATRMGITRYGHAAAIRRLATSML